MNNEKQLALKALIEKPSIYEVEVTDNSMLPVSLIDSKTIKLTVKPPTLEVLAKCALPVFRIPESVRESANVSWEEAIKYRSEMAEIIAILSHGKQDEYPEWLISFLLNNLEAKDLYIIFFESILKLQTDFFLNSFQIANHQNPMMMNQMKT